MLAAALFIASLAPSAGLPPTVRLDAAAHRGIAIAVGADGVELARDGEPCWLAVAELGQDVEIAAAHRHVLAIPPRRGRALVWLDRPVLLTRRLATQPATTVELTLRCAAFDDFAAWSELARFGALAAVAASIGPGLAADEAVAKLEQLDRLQALAAAPREVAAIEHVRAQALFASGQTRDAARGFARAERAWLAAGDAARATTARAGVVEDAIRAGDYAAALSAAADLPAGADAYFAARIEAARCLALHYLAQRETAARCYRTAIGRFAAQGERADAASIGIDLASLLIDLGHLDQAEIEIAAARALARDARNDFVSGRAALMQSELALRTARLATALHETDAAASAFERAGELRWLASAHLRIASLLGELGAYGDADAAIDAALALLESQDARPRIAAARLAKAANAYAAGDDVAALANARRALAGYEALGLTAEAAQSRTLAAAVLARQGDAVLAGQTLASGGAPGDRGRIARELVQAALDPGYRIPEVSTAGLTEAVAAAQLHARRLHAAGRTDAALAMLADTARDLDATAAAATSRVVGELLEPQRNRLRATAIDLIVSRDVAPAPVAASQSAVVQRDAAAASDERAVALVRPWLEAAFASPRPAPRAASAGWTPPDATLVNDLLATRATITPGAAVALMRTLARADSTGVGGSTARTLDAVRTALVHDEAVLAVMEGERGALAVWISQAAVRAYALGEIAALRTAVADADAALADPATADAEIAARVDALSRLLVAPIAPGEVPARLYVTGGTVAAAVPWAALSWRDGRALVELDAITVLERGAASPAAVPREWHVVSSSAANTAASLPALPAIATEPAWARTASRPRLHAHRDATPDDLLAALQRTDAAIYVGAHGLDRPARLAGSGVWLSDGSGESRALLTWLDVIERGAAAPLVVLDACSLDAARDGRAGGGINFAQALVRAGVREVVAARWTVSDDVGAQLMPRLVADRAHAGRALAAGMRALRDDIDFERAYDWAGWAHLASVDVLFDRDRAPAPVTRP